MKKIICILIALFGTFVYSQSKQNKVKELISLSGAFPLSTEFEDKFIATFKNNSKYKHVPEKAWVSIEKKIDINILVNEVAEIYGSNFTEKEIDQLLKFYKSEVGRKVIQNGKSIAPKIQELTRNWAMEATQTIDNDLVKMGYLESVRPPSLSPSPPTNSK